VRSRRVQVIRRRTYDFGDLDPGGSTSFVLLRSIPSAEFSRGTLMVRVHSLNVGSGDGQIDVAVKADGFTLNDPSELFFGQTLATLRAAADGDSAPRYVVESFAAQSDYLMVEVQASQDGSNSPALEAKVSVELVLDDGPVGWTPAQLQPVGWWRADLGHTAADGNPVSSWANQGALPGLDTSQGTGSRQPTYNASDSNFGGASTLSFDGGDVLSTAATDAWELPDGTDATIVVVARPNYVNNLDVFKTVAVTSGGLRLRLNTSGNSQAQYNDSSTSLDASQSGLTNQTVQAVASVLNASSSPTDDSSTVYIDGSGGSTNTADLGSIAPSSGTTELSLGGSTPTNGTFIGEIAEIIYCKALLTATEDSKLTSYLNQRYGLSLSSVTR